MTDIEERIKKVIIAHLCVDASKVKNDAHFMKDLGADSLDAIELIMAYEQEFGCEIPDEMAKEIETVNDAVEYIETLTPK